MAGIKAKISNALGHDSTTSGSTGTGTGAGHHHQSGTTGEIRTGGVTDVVADQHRHADHTHNVGGHSHGTRGKLVGGSGQVIDSKTFTKTEDHEVLIEKKAYELEHRPVQKEYVVETKYAGEQRVPGAATELVGTEAREVEDRIKEAPRGDRAVVVENVDVPAETLRQGMQQNTTTTGLNQRSNTGTY